ncbi:hypothetical protein [Erythrobacter sp.]|uniref:hypothetical protein n=1 Tax=Erythrobacter sp. TaxID=1042 RepID=UPI0032968602
MILRILLALLAFGIAMPSAASAQKVALMIAKNNIAQLLDPTATGGELNSDKPWIISLGATLPGRYAADLGAPLPIDGIWRISANDKRLRIERGCKTDPKTGRKSGR